MGEAKKCLKKSKDFINILRKNVFIKIHLVLNKFPARGIHGCNMTPSHFYLALVLLCLEVFIL